ncbi:glycosyl transferase family 28 [Mycolicibacterium mucogenicum 261Sha1.1M5]|nr:glycosyl transferase family 28 [Mycolicibacterium mucogenicum 261Sha1.1M5]
MSQPTTDPFAGFGVDRPRLLLAASTGGHLTQLSRFAHAAGVSSDATWVTFDSPQSRDMLAGERVVWVDYIAPRDVPGTLRARRVLKEQLDPSGFDGVISTGAAVALSAFLWARSNRVPGRYIESVSRTDGPSLTGRLVRLMRLANTYTQHAAWASTAWPHTTSVMRGFARELAAGATAGGGSAADRPLRIFVTLGTIKPYRFDRLVDRVLDIAGDGDEIVWQLGETTRDGLPGTTHSLMDTSLLLEEARAADVVVTHSGVGTILQLLGEGISPVVVPRERQHREHVDDHQLQIWQLLRDSGVADPYTVDQLTRAGLLSAAAHRTTLPGDNE